MSDYKYLGNFSAVDLVYSRHMECHNCKVSWTGCWDNFQCPQCGDGELPSSEIKTETIKMSLKEFHDLGLPYD